MYRYLTYSQVARVLKRNSLYQLAALILSCIIIACTHSSQSNPALVAPSPTETAALNIWWDKGYVLEEDEALQQVIKNWEQKSGIPVKLSLYTPDEIAQKAERAFQAGKAPDILFSSRAEYPLLAWEGKLADVSDVVQPVKSLYYPAALAAASLYNSIAQKQSYYAVPLHQATIHIFYWQDVLPQAGLKVSHIPRDWQGFWQFWEKLQDHLPAQSQQQVYGLGLPMSVAASDTSYLFEQVLEAYDVKILDQQGQLIDNPVVRQGIANCLEWYARFYQRGYVPPTAVKWLDPDNNRNLLNRVVVMTPNPTLSIPLALRQDSNTYRNQLGILEFPDKPSGQPMRYLVAVRQAVVFATAKHQEAAKEFLADLIQPQVIGDYLKSAGGRYLPVMAAAMQDPFWTNPADPHLSTATKTLIKGSTRLFYEIQNPAYSKVMEENIWGKALNRLIAEGVTPTVAAAEAIEQIKQIFTQLQR